MSLEKSCTNLKELGEFEISIFKGLLDVAKQTDPDIDLDKRLFQVIDMYAEPIRKLYCGDICYKRYNCKIGLGYIK